MFKQNSLLTLAVLTALILMSGCSQSDGNSTSKEVKADQEVTVINGHTLPPEPDPDINNATLLGVDSNDNGVRDDVERWIYKRYNTHIPCKMVEVNVTIPASGETVTGYNKVCEEKEVPYHQIVREIAMQGARAAQIIIQEPEKARETRKHIRAAVLCNVYFEIYAEKLGEPKVIDHPVIGEELDTIQFNTVQRARAYAKYNSALSGGVYPANETPQEMRASCDFDVDKLLNTGQALKIH